VFHVCFFNAPEFEQKPMSFNSAHWFARPKLIQLALQTKRPNPRQPTIFIQNSKWINYQRVSNPSVGEFSLGFVPITKRGLKKLARSLGRAESLGIHASLSFFLGKSWHCYHRHGALPVSALCHRSVSNSISIMLCCWSIMLREKSRRQEVHQHIDHWSYGYNQKCFWLPSYAWKI